MVSSLWGNPFLLKIGYRWNYVVLHSLFWKTKLTQPMAAVHQEVNVQFWLFSIQSSSFNLTQVGWLSQWSQPIVFDKFQTPLFIYKGLPSVNPGQSDECKCNLKFKSNHQPHKKISISSTTLSWSTFCCFMFIFFFNILPFGIKNNVLITSPDD